MLTKKRPIKKRCQKCRSPLFDWFSKPKNTGIQEDVQQCLLTLEKTSAFLRPRDIRCTSRPDQPGERNAIDGVEVIEPVRLTEDETVDVAVQAARPAALLGIPLRGLVPERRILDAGLDVLVRLERDRPPITTKMQTPRILQKENEKDYGI